MLTDEPTISSALADLAATTGDQPLPLAAIEVRARRMRRGRRAGRAGIVVICVATLATGIGLAGSGAGKPSNLTAFGTSPALLPLCAALPAQTAPAPLAKGSVSDDKKRAIAGAEATAIATARPAVGEKFKAQGTIAGTSQADAVTIVVAAPLNPTARPVTFAIGLDTQFFLGQQPIASRILRAGEMVGFVATRTGPFGYRLDEIETNPASPAGGSPRMPAAGSAATPAGQSVEGKGFLAEVPASRTAAVSVTVAGGPLAGSTLRFVVTPATRIVSGDRQCDPSGLPAGTPAAFTVTRTGAAGYRLDQLNL